MYTRSTRPGHYLHLPYETLRCFRRRMTSSSSEIRAKIKHHEKNIAGIGSDEALEGKRLRDETPSYKSREQSVKKRKRETSLFSLLRACVRIEL